VAGRYAIGVDVGGTKIAAGLVSGDDAAILVRRHAPTGAGRDGAEVLGDAVRLAEELTAEAERLGAGPQAIGIGVPELVDLDGRVRSSSNFDWREIDVAAAFSRLAPARVESDVRAAALAEARVGAGRGHASFAYVTVGTGISHALVVDGRPYAGSRGAAILLGSGVIGVPCAACGSRAEVVLEEVCSGPGLVRDFALRGGRAERAEEVVTLAERGDPVAVAVLERAGELLGCGVGLLVNLLDPEAVVVGGGLGSARDARAYWHSLVASARAHVWAPDARSLPIVRSELGADSGLVGAALAALE
jgi:glucokinase